MSFLVHAINFSTKYFSSQVILMLAFMKATNVWIINFFLEHFQYLVSGFTTLMSINKLEKSYIVISKSILLFTFCVFLSSVCQGGKPWIISGFFRSSTSPSFCRVGLQKISIQLFMRSAIILESDKSDSQTVGNELIVKQNCELYSISGDNKALRTRWTNCYSPLYDYRTVCKRIFV